MSTHFSSEERSSIREAFELLTQPKEVVNIASLLESLNDCIRFSQGTHPNQHPSTTETASTLPFSQQILSQQSQYHQHLHIYQQLFELISEAYEDKTQELTLDDLINTLEGYLNSTRNMYTQDDLRHVFLLLSNGTEHITVDSLRNASTIFSDDISIQSIISTFQQTQHSQNNLRFPTSMAIDNDLNPMQHDNDVKVTFQQFVEIMKSSPPAAHD